ncbi:MAG TPA: MFS transporter [Oscillatoriaceae cyanobacterium]
MAATVQSAEYQPLGEQIRSYNRSFWFANIMEMLERWAYYGVRTVLPLYIVAASADGGLNFNHLDKGFIFAWWAWWQSLLPMFTGGYADRYGYKKTVAVSVGIKTIGYLLMGTQHSFWGFFTGCMFLATGTAIFKPGVQGLIAHNVSDKNASVGWGIFYQLVNIGGFLGPITANLLRENHPWSWVFYGNAVLVALNFVSLLMFKEPDIPRPPKLESAKEMVAEFWGVFVESIKNLFFQPRLFLFVLIFSGFWLTFNEMFDLLPNFLDDWISSTNVLMAWGQFWVHVPVLSQVMGAQAAIASAAKGGNVAPELMLNVDPGAIVFLMIPIAAIASRFKPLPAICLGILVTAIGMLLLGSTTGGWLCAGGIFVFAIGEMLASPRTNDYFASIAPADKKGLYLGYANVPNAIGWGIGSWIGGELYQYHADKVQLAQDYMVSHFGMTRAAVNALPKDQVLSTMAAKAHLTVAQAQQLLWNLDHPVTIWYVFAAIGLASMIGMLIYNLVVTRIDRQALEKVIPADNATIAS